MIQDLTERTREILRLVIDAYVETGAPVGSRLISERLGMRLSPATIRNTMMELEERGLLYSPHTSAGRLPTDTGLTVFVEGLMEVGDIAEGDRRTIEREIEEVQGQPLPDILAQTSAVLSGLSSCAGLVVAPTTEAAVRQIEFVLLSPGRALAVLVGQNGEVENRMFDVPAEVTASSLQRAANYLNAQIEGGTLQEAAARIRAEIAAQQTQLDALTQKVVSSGLASLSPKEAGGHFFVRGQANLLGDVTALEDLERIRGLFSALEAKETMLKILDATAQADGVKIFIGAENALFDHAGCTLVVSPCRDQQSRIVGAIGVIGPTRLNYGRIIPVVRYTSQMIGKIVG